jgi:hypothetical protein
MIILKSHDAIISQHTFLHLMVDPAGKGNFADVIIGGSW